MMDAFLYIGLPYLAVVTAVVGCYWRWRTHRFTMSSRSSQFLEDRQLLWGSTPWHIGILIVLLGHVIAALLPRVWSSLMTVPWVLFTVETVGVACSVLALAGLSLLIVRRVTSARVQAVTTTMDMIVLLLLFVQVLTGLLSATHYRYGAAWSTGTVIPYFWSLVTLRPDMAYVTGLPALFKLHLVGAWLLILVLPFTRLIHVLSIPIGYLWRAPQLVVWNTLRRRQHAVATTARAESRRDFVRGFTGLAGASGLLAVGVSEKSLNFFRGPRSDPEAESALLEKRLRRLRQTVEERELELERQRNDAILVARYSELTGRKGKYFIDYSMAPGLAFLGADGMPIVISAKCTHLGCTVASDVDDLGRILCPCHVSWFDIVTGRPHVGAPTRVPLPHIAWALMDPQGKVVARQQSGQPVEGTTNPEVLASCNLYITRPGREIPL
jgi:nitrate reductase gamma subunit